MDFKITGTRTRVITITVTEEIEGEVSITKAEVKRITDCPDKVDGDPSHWYDLVGEAIQDGAKHKVRGEIVEIDREEVVRDYWDDVEIDW